MSTLVSCKKCKKALFYLPDKYKLGIKVMCVECNNKIKTKPQEQKSLTASYAKMRKGIRKDIHSEYSFKSATEANFARILNRLEAEWTYEEHTFAFSAFGYKTKPFVYIMDFEIKKSNPGAAVLPVGFYEIKGYMTGSARNKLRRLKKHYPKDAEKTTIVIYNKSKKEDIAFCEKLGYKYIFYSDLVLAFSASIPGWE